MNFFFGIKSKNLSCKITIPKFQNFGKPKEDMNVYEAIVLENSWKIQKMECGQNNSFFFIEDNSIENNKIFFLANDNEVSLMKKQNELIKINNFTNTSPAFRSNLRLSIPNKGFSSYQSEYPIEMTRKKGSILSPVSMLLNSNADINYIFLKNIYFKPRHDESNLYFIDYKKKKIIDKVKIKLNFLNEIKVEKNKISKDIFIYSEECLGIPIYVSIKDHHISLEHTHPPHHYILSEDRHKTVAKIKNEFKKIIS